MSRKVKTPLKVTSFEDVCAMPRDNVGTDDHWILTDGYEVTIAAQRVGELSTETISLPKRTFDAFVRWYMTGIWKRPRRKAVKK